MEGIQEPENIDFSDLDKKKLIADLYAKSFSIEAVLNHLKKIPEFHDLLSAGAGVAQGYTIEAHTKMVMQQFEKYFSSGAIPVQTDQGFFRILLALHDIGKPLAIKKGDKNLQHEETVPLVKKFLEYLGCNQSIVNLASALLGGDPIGCFLKGEISIKEAKKSIFKLAESAHLRAIDFFQILKVVYMSDAGSYTVDAGGPKALDGLFKFHKDERTMDFAEPYRSMIKGLEENLISAHD